MTSTTAPAPSSMNLPAALSALATRVVAAPGAATATTVSPIDAAPLPSLPLSTPDDVARAAARARAADAQPSWAATPVRERVRVAARFAQLVLQNEDRILDVIQLESGKNRLSAFEEVVDVSRVAAHYGHAAPRLLRDTRHDGALSVLTRTVETRSPRGIVGIISPWNYPLTLTVGDALPALIAGNAVICKPDSNTPFTALLAAELLEQAGLPDGLFQVVHGAGRTIGTPLIEASDFMMFTGSTATGRHIAEQCGRSLIPFSAELGGKNPLLVLDDADLDAAVPGAVRACFSNSGQLCVSIERIYVTRAVADEFIPRFTEAVKGMRLGAGFDWEVDMGTLITTEHLATVQSHVDDAVSKGATVLAGGRPRPELGPCFFEPTVLADVPADAVPFRAETFGPVVSVYVVDDEEAAIAAANDTEYGLNASVWSRRRGSAVARRLDAGNVNVNEGYAATWGSYGSPMGGWKASGVGARHGRDGLLKYTRAKTIARQTMVPIAPFAGLTQRGYAGWLSRGVRVLNRLN